MRNTLSAATVVAVLAFVDPAAGQPGAGAEIAAIRAEIAALTARLDRLEQATARSGARLRRRPPRRRPRRRRASSSRGSRPPTVRTCGSRATCATATSRSTRRSKASAIGTASARGSARRPTLRRTSSSGSRSRPAATIRSRPTRRSTPASIASRSASTARSSAGRPRRSSRSRAARWPTPFYRPGDHHLIYDTDLNPEGLAVRYGRGDWFANYAASGSKSAARPTTRSCSAASSAIATLDDGMRITAGAGYYDYLETQGQTPFWDGAAVGNRVDAAGNYLNDFNLAQLFGELSFKRRRAAAHGVRGLRRQHRGR